MLSEDALTRALELAGLRAPVRFDEVTRSTQESALRMAADGAPEWTLVAAAHQTAGRGRLGRSWMDEAGGALMFSMVLRPTLTADRGGLISLLAGGSLARASEELTGRRTTCKWPNDVLVGGRKAAGILVEARLAGGRFEHAVVGIGANLGSAPAALPEAGAIEAVDAELLAAFLRAFVAGYRADGADFSELVLGAYRARCATLGSRVRATTVGGEVVQGEAVDLDEAGGLVVHTTDGLATVRFGEVEHLG
jgi:BirA family biotin operon repressor/biotin-[acetyl-CoA-carboxylase] ligase